MWLNILYGVGNQVHMAVVPEHVHCENLILRNDYCDLENDPCNAHCKVHYRSTKATGSCDIDINLCVCLYCRKWFFTSYNNNHCFSHQLECVGRWTEKL